MRDYNLSNGYVLKAESKLKSIEVNKGIYSVYKNSEILGQIEVEIVGKNVIFTNLDLFPCIGTDIKTELINKILELGNVTIELKDSRASEFFNSN